MNEPRAKRISVSPLARRRARELSLDLMSIAGSGPQGRIVVRDLHAARHLDPSHTRDDARAGILPHGRHRAPQAMRFHDSVRAPLIITTECDVDALVAMREQMNRMAPKTGESSQSQRITMNDCLVKAMALAARARTGKSVSVGIALGSASAPIVIADACTLVMPALAQAIRAARAEIKGRDNNQASAQAHVPLPADGDHADVLIANFGVFGARDAEFPASTRYPIVLSLGAAHQAAVVRHGQIVIATVLHATLCVGEGVLDAATAGTMLAAFRQYVESPAAMLV
ncbi:MAG: 2-oxo acid dehydrogenase subunit E2 [Beijerinckiaceae bacterium]